MIIALIFGIILIGGLIWGINDGDKRGDDGPMMF